MSEIKEVITEKNVEKYVKKIGEWIKNIVENAHANGVVLGMSGGVDCSTVARLCQYSNINVHLVLMPYGKNMENIGSHKDAMDLIERFNFEFHEFDIKPAVDSLKINKENDNVVLAHSNLKPRIRMTYLYEYAQLNNLLVIGTGNLSERTVGYSTKWGDSASDLNPLGEITKREVYVLAKYLGLPEHIINKKPSADLWEGQSDEAEMGITYNQIDDFILKNTSGNEETDNIIIGRINRNIHKNIPIPVFPMFDK